MNHKLYILITIMGLISSLSAAGQGKSIAYIVTSTSGSWYYLYDSSGKKIGTLGASAGELVGYSDSFIILRHNSWYYLYDANCKKYQTLGVDSIGEIKSVTSQGFTAVRGSWIMTYDRNGKKLSTKAAR